MTEKNRKSNMDKKGKKPQTRRLPMSGSASSDGDRLDSFPALAPIKLTATKKQIPAAEKVTAGIKKATLADEDDKAAGSLFNNPRRLKAINSSKKTAVPATNSNKTTAPATNGKTGISKARPGTTAGTANKSNAVGPNGLSVGNLTFPKRKKENKPTNRSGSKKKPAEEEPDDGNYNSDLPFSETFIRMDREKWASEFDNDPQLQPMKRNLLVDKYEREKTDHMTETWRKKPEIPTVEELSADAVDLCPNVIEGPYENVEEYLATHYELLREDAVAGLRDAISYIREFPHSNDTHEIAIYENVRIVGMTFSPSVGMCMKVTFSINRAGKRIRWAASKRLCPGSLLCISDDEFRTFKVVTVAARPLEGVENMHPPEVNLHFQPNEVEIDSSKTFMMIEHRSSYFEAYKWTLKALQRMKHTEFPLKDQICFLNKQMLTPEYLRTNPLYDLSGVFPDTADTESLEEVNILQEWPNITTSMDDSQMAALKSIVCDPIAVIQGPPGTGKTYTSVMALNVILQNMTKEDPPLIVACQTNHALDQILRHILKFESNIIRLGGRTQDRGEILARTLYQVRRKSPITLGGGPSYGRGRAQLSRLLDAISVAMQPLCSELMTPKDLLGLKIINQKQHDSFETGHQDWVQAQDDEKLSTPIAKWLGDSVELIPPNIDMCADEEEGDVEFEMLKDMEAEFLGTGDSDDVSDGLFGPFKSVRHNYRVHCPLGISEEELQKAGKQDDLWKLSDSIRAALYHHWRKLATAKVFAKVKKLNVENQQAVLNFKIAKWERDSAILSKAKVIGMTTTGLSKYRSLVASIQPKVVLIEEAAEALEGPAVVACMPSVQQLILVGDHKQLRGKCAVRELDDEPYNLNVSLFERWVLNNMPYTTLRTQRRMRPEIREILTPIYGDQLRDHVTVLDREPLKGMGNINMFWHSHQHGEEMMLDTPSRTNKYEAEMITKFCEYLVLNGHSSSSITILTFYTGQRSLIARKLYANPNLQGAFFKIATVDSYQGEENDIVILSLVRSNAASSIGFLNVANRVCVALSRAQRGFYIFGNAPMITAVDPLWWDVANILSSKSPKRVGRQFPLTCHRHKNVTPIEKLSDWDAVFGGCTLECEDKLPCGHPCPNNCHPFEHDDYRCLEQCGKVLMCGHKCDGECWEDCLCEGCGLSERQMEMEAESGEEDEECEPKLVEGYALAARWREREKTVLAIEAPKVTKVVRTAKPRA